MIPLRARIVLIALVAMALAGCTQQQAAQTPDPKTILQAIPAADSGQYNGVHDMKTWRNPYLIVRPDGVAVYDIADSAEIIVKPEELLTELAKFPASNWPYGRVVAAAEAAKRDSDQDAVAIRRNKGIIGGLLEGSHIAVKWVPGT